MTDQAVFETGHVIAGRYRVIRRLGMGGMGAVYEAEHLELGRPVAVKVLLPELSSSGNMVARFMREARSAAQIGHPGIVQVFDLGSDGPAPFLVMEKLEGEELAARIEREHPLPIEWVVKMGIELCDAVQAAHDHGIVHRDLKPPNVFLARQGRNHDVVKVLDFGIAKLTQGADSIQTRTGQVFGTPMYMAPEQLRDSKDVDGRADIYGIGCILYQALVGKPPFEAATYPDLVFRICCAPRPRASDMRADVPRALSEVIARAMQVSADDRFASPGALATALGTPANVPPLHESVPSGAPPGELGAPATALTPHSPTAPPKLRSLRAVGSVLVGLGLVGAAAASFSLRDQPEQPRAGPVAVQPPADGPRAAASRLLPQQPEPKASTSASSAQPSSSTPPSHASPIRPARVAPVPPPSAKPTPKSTVTKSTVTNAPPPLVPQ